MAALAIGGALAVAIVLTVLVAGHLIPNIAGTFGGASAPSTTEPSYPRAEASPPWDDMIAQGSAQDGEALYASGRSGVQACVGCHGKAGVPPSGAPMPRLGGVAADYIAKQLSNYRDGSRANEIMTGIARAMTPKEVGSVALYLAHQTPVWTIRDEKQGEPRADEVPERGRVLQELGDGDRQIPACGNCHGPQGRGETQSLPPLAGLPADYIQTQLDLWQSGKRHNDALGVMASIAKRLSPEDIRAVAQYYAAFR